MKKLLPFIILIVVLIGIVVAIPILLQSTARRQQMVDYLSKMLHHKVVIGKMDSSFFPPSFELHEVGVFAEGVETPALQIDEAVVGVGIGALFGGTFQPNSVTLNHPIFQFHRRPNGTWDSDEWASVLGAISGGAQSSVKVVSIHGGEVHWVDSFAAAPQELIMKSVESKLDHAQSTLKLAGELSGVVAPVSLSFEGNGSFGSQSWSGELHLTDQARQCSAHVQAQDTHMSITGQSAEWRWDQTVSFIGFLSRVPLNVAPDAPPTYLKDWKFDVQGSSAGVSVIHSAGLGGGMTDATLKASQGTSGLLIVGAATFKDVKIQDACGPWGGCASVAGTMTAAVPHFSVSVSSGSSMTTASGTLDVVDGRYMVPDVSIQKLSRTHMLKYVKARYPGMIEKGFAFTRVHAQGSLSNGILTLQDAMLKADGLRAGLAGHLEPGKKAVDAYARLQINDTSMDRMQYIPGKYISGQAGHERVQPIYGHLQGVWDEWILRAVPSYKIPTAVQNQLKKSVTE